MAWIPPDACGGIPKVDPHMPGLHFFGRLQVLKTEGFVDTGRVGRQRTGKGGSICRTPSDQKHVDVYREMGGGRKKEAEDP